MVAKVKTVSILALTGLLFGVLPVTWLYAADSDRGHSSGEDTITNTSIQFVLVQFDRERLEQLMAESKTLTLESIPMAKIGQCVRDKDGADIISQTRLTVVSGYEAEMNTVENSNHQAKNPDKPTDEQVQREIEVSINIKVDRREGNRLAARLAYKRNVVEKSRHQQAKAEEEEEVEQRFDVSTGIVLRAGKMQLAGIQMNDDLATLLLMKAEL